MKKDWPEIVYGVGCTWWESISKVAQTPTGLPICPHCASVLMQVPNIDSWWKGIDKRVGTDQPKNFHQMVEWQRGKCFKNMATAWEEYRKVTGETKCARCNGCGSIADSEQGEPWTYWAELPRGSNAAVVLGVVKPIPCPVCDGSGVKL